MNSSIYSFMILLETFRECMNSHLLRSNKRSVAMMMCCLIVPIKAHRFLHVHTHTPTWNFKCLNMVKFFITAWFIIHQKVVQLCTEVYRVQKYVCVHACTQMIWWIYMYKNRHARTYKLHTQSNIDVHANTSPYVHTNKLKPYDTYIYYHTLI